MIRLGSLIAVLLMIAVAGTAGAQEPFPGRSLVSATGETETHLVEMDGTIVQTWHGAQRARTAAYLLDDGSVIRPCKDVNGTFVAITAGGRIQRIDTNDVVVWDILVSGPNYIQHHDIQPMPNGNVLAIVWQRKTEAEAAAVGRVTAMGSEIWPDAIFEIELTGPTSSNVVWEWHVWDHLIQDVDPGLPGYGVIADHPELIDINFHEVTGGSWTHLNSVDYDAERDLIIFSSRNFDEVYIIDHGTTTAEAAGHTGGNYGKGGDILYRWGNPQTYGRGGKADRVFFVTHGANIIDPGLPGYRNLLVISNGDRDGDTDDYFEVFEFTPPTDINGNFIINPGEPFGPADPVWSYRDPDFLFFGATQGNPQRLPNGNTFLCLVDNGHMREVTEDGTTVWDWEYGARVGRALKYYDPGASAVPDGQIARAVPVYRLLSPHPNPFNPQTVVRFELDKPGQVELAVFDLSGRRVALLAKGDYGEGEYSAIWNGRDTSGRLAASGNYLVRMRVGASFMATRTITLLK